MKQYILVIDTDSYAGNFEREMTAYCTGEVGECGVGEEEAEIFQEETGENFSAKIESRPDEEDGCQRPCEIWKNGAGPYNSVAIFFSRKPSKKDVLFIKSRADKYGELNKIKILGIRLLMEETVIKEISY